MRRLMLTFLAISGAAALGGYLHSAAATQRFERAAPAAGMFVDIDGVTIHVIDIGPKESQMPPVVLIHGASVNGLDMFTALGERLAQERRVLIVDRPGQGYSTRPQDGWRLDRQAWLIRWAAHARGVERPIVVGQSFGGAVALRYGLDFQDDVAGLVLLAPVSHEWPGGVAWYNHVSGAPIAGQALRRVALPILGPRLAANDFADAFAPLPPPQDYARRAGSTLLFRPSSFAANAEDLRRLKPQIAEQQSRYGELRIPVSIVVGEADTAVSPEIHSRALARDVAHAELVAFDGVGHPIHHAKPAEIIDLIRQTASDSRWTVRSPAESAL